MAPSLHGHLHYHTAIHPAHIVGLSSDRWRPYAQYEQCLHGVLGIMAMCHEIAQQARQFVAQGREMLAVSREVSTSRENDGPEQ
jgi:hypothetical protein